MTGTVGKLRYTPGTVGYIPGGVINRPTPVDIQYFGPLQKRFFPHPYALRPVVVSIFCLSKPRGALRGTTGRPRVETCVRFLFLPTRTRATWRSGHGPCSSAPIPPSDAMVARSSRDKKRPMIAGACRNRPQASRRSELAAVMEANREVFQKMTVAELKDYIVQQGLSPRSGLKLKKDYIEVRR